MNEEFNSLLKIVEVLFIPFGIYVVRGLQAVVSEVRSVKEALIGVDGKNGIRSRVEKLEIVVEDLRFAVAKLSAKQAIRHGEDSSDD